MRSIAVSTLSSLPMDKAQTMTVEQYAEQINKAFNVSYEREQMEKPFTKSWWASSSLNKPTRQPT
jgi:flagellar FliL protein